MIFFLQAEVAQAGPIHYLLLAVTSSLFIYMFYRMFVQKKTNENLIKSLADNSVYKYNPEENSIEGHIVSCPFTFERVLYYAFGRKQSDFRFLVWGVPGFPPHMEISRKQRVGHEVVFTLWNRPPMFEIEDTLYLWSSDEENAARYLKGGLENLLRRYAPLPFTVHLTKDGNLELSKGKGLQSWSEEDFKAAVNFSTELIEILENI